MLWPRWVTAKLLRSNVVARRKSELQPGGEVGLSTGDTICWEEPCTWLRSAPFVEPQPPPCCAEVSHNAFL